MILIRRAPARNGLPKIILRMLRDMTELSAVEAMTPLKHRIKDPDRSQYLSRVTLILDLMNLQILIRQDMT